MPQWKPCTKLNAVYSVSSAGGARKKNASFSLYSYQKGWSFSVNKTALPLNACCLESLPSLSWVFSYNFLPFGKCLAHFGHHQEQKQPLYLSATASSRHFGKTICFVLTLSTNGTGGKEGLFISSVPCSHREFLGFLSIHLNNSQCSYTTLPSVSLPTRFVHLQVE